jgi:hypothetical protein
VGLGLTVRYSAVSSDLRGRPTDNAPGARSAEEAVDLQAWATTAGQGTGKTSCLWVFISPAIAVMNIIITSSSVFSSAWRKKIDGELPCMDVITI